MLITYLLPQIIFALLNSACINALNFKKYIVLCNVIIVLWWLNKKLIKMKWYSCVFKYRKVNSLHIFNWLYIFCKFFYGSGNIITAVVSYIVLIFSSNITSLATFVVLFCKEFSLVEGFPLLADLLQEILLTWKYLALLNNCYLFIYYKEFKHEWNMYFFNTKYL